VDTNRIITEKAGPMALISLEHAPMTGFKRNKLDAVRGKYNEWDVSAMNPDGSPLDLTGAVVHFSVFRRRKIKGDSLTYWDPIIEVTDSDPDIDVTDPAEGLLTIALARQRTEAIDPDLYFYDLWIEAGANRIDLIQKAEFRVNE
jgi:hypothetical protein